MRMISNPRRLWRRIGVAGGVPLLALALGTGDADARSPERGIGSGATQKSAAPGIKAQEPRTAAPPEHKSAGVRNHDPCCVDEPPVPRARLGTTTMESRVSPGTVRRQPTLRGSSLGASPAVPEVRPTGSPAGKRSGHGKPARRWRTGDQRRGGVGTLIGITFA